jgi:hypothetical protein
MEKLKVDWITPPHDIVGNALGYNSHNSAMRKYSEPLIEIDSTSDVCLQICPGDNYKRVEGKINVLFTMWEAHEIPTEYVLALNQADFIIVPCRFCRDLFRKYTNKPIYICGEAVDPDVYQ